eukprot:8030955-Pyramimonas_sp.AAC.1
MDQRRWFQGKVEGTRHCPQHPRTPTARFKLNVLLHKSWELQRYHIFDLSCTCGRTQSWLTIMCPTRMAICEAK